MRCLHCGKHLPLLRKLTGGGEFCSDAHRDEYHEQYNRLAVSRLVDARAKPEEAKPNATSGAQRLPPQAAANDKPSKQARVSEVVAAAPTRHTGSAAPPVTSSLSGAPGSSAPQPLAELPATQKVTAARVELEAPPSSYVDEFAPIELQPRRLERPSDSALELSPVLPAAPVLVHPSSQAVASCATGAFAPPQAAGYLVSRSVARSVAFAPHQAADPVMAAATAPSSPAIPAFGRQIKLPAARAVAVEIRPAPRAVAVKPLEAGVHANEIAAPKPLLRSTLAPVSARELPIAGSLNIEMALAPPPAGAPGMTAMLDFPWLAALRPAFDSALQLIDDPAESSPSTSADLTPSVVLAALSHAQVHMQVETKGAAQTAPEPSTLRPLAATAAAPGPGALAAGFESVRWRSHAALLDWNTVPFRPKMAIGAAPLRTRKDQTGNSRISPRSMLQLEADARQDMPEDLEGGSLLGKLGGLFGKRQKNG